MNICPDCKKEIQKIVMFTSVEYSCNCQNQEKKLESEYDYYFGNKTNYIPVTLEWDFATKQWYLKAIDRLK